MPRAHIIFLPYTPKMTCPVVALSRSYTSQASPTYEKIYGTAANKVTSLTSKVCVDPFCEFLYMQAEGRFHAVNALRCVLCLHL